MKLTKSEAVIDNWENVESLNYKLKGSGPYESVVYAKLTGKHSVVHNEEIIRVYYILSGSGVYEINGEHTKVEKGDVITIPKHATYDYWPEEGTEIEILLFMELWDN